MKYQLTHKQFIKQLEDVIALFIEHNQQLGYDEELASIAAVNALLDCMTEERDLIRHGELQATEASHTVVAQ